MAAPLLIMRHGEAVPGFPDSQRRLTDHGHKEASAMGVWLATRSDIDLAGLRVIASPYIRAQQTATRVVESLADARGCQTRLDIVTLGLVTPNDPPYGVVAWLMGQADDSPMLLVSHMPLVASLAGLLVDGHSDSGVGFATAAIAELTGDVRASGCLSLRRIVAPEDVM